MNNNETMTFISKAERAKARLNAMSLEEGINYWNKKNCDHYCRLNGISKMEDEDRWDEIATELGAWTFYRQLSLSDKFNDSDRYFGYIHDSCEFFSVSTKQELMELMEDWFTDEILVDIEEEDRKAEEQKKTYNVQLYFSGCYDISIKAKDKEDAVRLAEQLVEKMNEVELLDAIQVQRMGYDCYEEN